ncbi:MAG: DUF2163 domain-containing protein [Alphaproteobacteria bacterium]|nr:DUF2163 domain-containing protein [Alphaproteobacteria bacterium]MBU0793191.1 DUF2163 domain-containing protein [Alphaproteobacteria bacterium]MBU0875761.1 DUF2163 domain-containing protein [Alphaproteobacteria bacterium]MBU1769048.1 DUF2163 domain-containing protein [Alphaproteobacteria bacterium]
MSAAEILGKPLCALAFCWRLERRDGVTIGLTSHDRALTIDGLLYAATPGITPSAILRGGGEQELTELQGAISSAAISEADLDAGRWDGATLLLHLTEWTDPGVLWVELARGEFGGIERSGAAYSVGLRSGLANVLERAVAPVTSATCRAALGDRDCSVDLRRHQRIVSVSEVADEAVLCAGLVAGRYPFGRLRWLEGPNCGLVQPIVDQDGDTLFLSEPPAFPVTPGTRALLTEGCDKRLATCAGRFGNAVNFRGEPHLPGMDLLTRYPGS